MSRRTTRRVRKAEGPSPFFMTMLAIGVVALVIVVLFFYARGMQQRREENQRNQKHGAVMAPADRLAA